jgi:hypothetical protein
MAGVSAGDIQQVAKVLERYRGGVRRDDAKGGGGKSGGPDVEQEDKAWSSGRIRWPPVSAGSPEFRLFSKAPPFRRFAVSGLAALNHAFFDVTGILLIAVNLANRRLGRYRRRLERKLVPGKVTFRWLGRRMDDRHRGRVVVIPRGVLPA